LYFVAGSSWSPKSPSGSLVLIFSLCFALVIYNAYAAFITSVLSVRVASIRGLGDLLESDFHFGYRLGGQDEAFLRVGNLGYFLYGYEVYTICYRMFKIQYYNIISYIKGRGKYYFICSYLAC
jgi:hypothetical protein